MIGSVAVIAALVARVAAASQNTSDDSPFLWGAASAAYQVEGQVHADNRGKSIWDVWLDEDSLAGPGISGATSINFYDPQQYQKDIGFLKRMGLTSYRFSISWTRIIPDGLGPVNMAGVNHYREFITHLKAAGIEPMLTMYHWDMPATLSEAGSWHNRDSINWFRRYAEVVFDHFHDLVENFVVINEPSSDVGFTLYANKVLSGDKNATMSALPMGPHDLEYSLRSYNHILLSGAAAKEVFDTKNYTGSLGMAIPIFPALTSANATSQDRQNAKYADGIYNRWFLDSIVNGTYPQDILDLCKKLKIDPKIRDNDAATIGDAGLDFMGVNFYSPLYVRTAKGSNSSAYNPETYMPDNKPIMANGPVEPDQFKDVLLRIKNEYKNIPVYITENGASFKGDDVLKNDKVLDKKRCKYLVDHIEAMKEAQEEGADIRGYHAWSSHDNLEWLSGYSTRFGICYVDYDTQERTPKLSSKVYSSIIAGRNVTADSCDATTY